MQISKEQDKSQIMNQAFAEDVNKGLSSKNKYLESKYFYDDKGDQLFQKIMGLSEYYLTDCEFEILFENRDVYREYFQNTRTSFSLIELGAGDGLKTKILLRHFYQHNTDFTYLPIDISGNVLSLLQKDLRDELPGLHMQTFQGDYFDALKNLNATNSNRKVILFLGSTIGNFAHEQAIDFLQKLNENMNPDDQLLIGFDLKKDPRIILRAYDDEDGVTRAFNLNLLERINRELGGEFNTDNFYHYPTYDPVTGETKSFLISKRAQDVYIRGLQKNFHFHMGEPIFMEISQKYDLENIRNLASKTGFKIEDNFFDTRKFYTNSLWIKK